MPVLCEYSAIALNSSSVKYRDFSVLYGFTFCFCFFAGDVRASSVLSRYFTTLIGLLALTFCRVLLGLLELELLELELELELLELLEIELLELLALELLEPELPELELELLELELLELELELLAPDLLVAVLCFWGT